jgi:hypothetical protein
MDTRWRYDIVRKESEKAIYWLEAAPELSVARARIEELRSFWPGEYQIFDVETKQAVLTTSDLCAMPVGMPASNAAE